MNIVKLLSIWSVALFCGAAVGSHNGLAQTAQGEGPVAIANTVFTSQTGQLLRLGDLQGKVVLVYFWGSWCAS